MKVKAVRSGPFYQKIIDAPPEKKDDIYRYELMVPFKKKWDCYNIPIKAQTKNGYDVIMASEMLGYLVPTKVDNTKRDDVKRLSSDDLWSGSQKAIERSLDSFTSRGIELNVTDYLFTVLLADKDNPYVILSEGYSGDSGIPGYIFAWLTPNDYTINRLPAALAHETNHNVRFQFIKWRNDITLGEMIVSEGLAENFAVNLYGYENLGPWVTKTSMDTLNDYIKPIIKDGLGVQGLENLSSYLYGDEPAKMQNYIPVGLPYCAGYACGYHLVKHYLKKAGKDIVDATILPADEILKEAEDFWGD